MGAKQSPKVREKIRIKVKGYDHSLVDAASQKIAQTAHRTGSKFSGPIPLPTEKHVVTILRSVHINKDSREQFARAECHNTPASYQLPGCRMQAVC